MENIDWSKAPDGFDYWIVPEKGSVFPPDFHKLIGDRYYDINGEYYEECYLDDVTVYKRPEKLIPFYGENVMQEKKEITDEMIVRVLHSLDKYASTYFYEDYGLPMFGKQVTEMVQIVKEALGLETELDKRIRDIQAVDSTITKEQAKKLIEAGIVK